MHELGIIVQMIRTLEEVAAENQVRKIGSVTLEIGEVSGIIPDYFEDCWKFYSKKYPLLEGAKLRIEQIPGASRCGDCGRIYETVKYGRSCPYCGSENTWLEQGKECSIREIEAIEEE